MADQFIGRRQNLGSTPKVFLQPDRRDARKVALEAENIFDLIFGLDTSFLKILAEEGSSK